LAKILLVGAHTDSDAQALVGEGRRHPHVDDGDVDTGVAYGRGERIGVVCCPSVLRSV